MRARSHTVLKEQRCESLVEEFHRTRALTRWLCENLEIEDFVVQPYTEVSPPKWHLAHSTWFFEQFILKAFSKTYREFSPEFSYLFNSYYKSQGQHCPQDHRGGLSRPTVKEIFTYRSYVDEALDRFLNQGWYDSREANRLLKVGIEHEKQHQELLLMDIKAILSVNHPAPTYFRKTLLKAESTTQKFDYYAGGIYEIGANAGEFHFDNEGPRHRRLINSFSISNCFVTNQQFLEFIDDGGYGKANLWLSDGWNWLEKNSHHAPMYWIKSENEGWREFTLHGVVDLDPHAPVAHLNYFEANAFANWAGARLPREEEYELFLGRMKADEIHDQSIGFLTSHFHALQADGVAGELWGWTQSQYSPYPNYRAETGALGEYNGKFMCNQFVLRGGCVASPTGHFRSSYRNFYQPQQRWMFSGLRLAKDNV